MPHSAELRLRAMRHCAESIFRSRIEANLFLCDFESIFKTALAHESWDPGVLFEEKNRGRISRETVPLRMYRHFLR
jgi:hypothetical protein